MASKDPVYAKMVLSVLEKRGEVVSVADLDNYIADMEVHLETQLMKTVASRSPINATRRSARKRGATLPFTSIPHGSICSLSEGPQRRVKG